MIETLLAICVTVGIIVLALGLIIIPIIVILRLSIDFDDWKQNIIVMLFGAVCWTACIFLLKFIFSILGGTT